MSKSATLPTDLSSPGSFAIFSPPQAVCAAAAGAHTAPPSSSCPGTPGPGPLDPTPGNSPALPPSAGRYARRRGPASTPAAAAAAAAWPPMTSEPAPAQAGVPLTPFRCPHAVKTCPCAGRRTGVPCCGTRPAPGQSPGSNGQRLSFRRSLSFVPPSAMCFTHLCPTFSNVFHAPPQSVCG